MAAADIRMLPKSMQRAPHIRAFSLAVIPLRNGTFVVQGSEFGYQFSLIDGRATRCECKAARSGHKRCAHVIALQRFLEQQPPNARQGA